MSVVVLTGGVGGAKLVLGLAQILPPAEITAIVNTGDDFRHLGLWISPDLDTLLYTLSDKANTAQGWGREGETWTFLETLRTLGGEDWFALGDGDLALHVLRTLRMGRGETLAEITADFARHWGVGITMLPMSNNLVATSLETDVGRLAFQSYFVERRCAPIVDQIIFDGAAQAKPAPGVCEAILSPRTRAIIIAPSNPYLSIDPLLAIPDITAALRAASAPVIAVTPIVGGNSVKGPTAKLMRELGVAVSPTSVATHYGELLDGFVFDERDPTAQLPLPKVACDTLMHSLADRARVAEAVLRFADTLR